MDNQSPIQRISIKNYSQLPLHEAVAHVREVIQQGRVSDRGTSYAYATTFADGTAVETSIVDDADQFVVCDYAPRTEATEEDDEPTPPTPPIERICYHCINFKMCFLRHKVWGLITSTSILNSGNRCETTPKLGVDLFSAAALACTEYVETKER